MICPSCGSQTDEENVGLCSSHHNFYPSNEDKGWSRANRIWCAYFHGGVPIPRLYPEPLTDNIWIWDTHISTSLIPEIYDYE